MYSTKGGKLSLVAEKNESVLVLLGGEEPNTLRLDAFVGPQASARQVMALDSIKELGHAAGKEITCGELDPETGKLREKILVKGSNVPSVTPMLFCDRCQKPARFVYQEPAPRYTCDCGVSLSFIESEATREEREDQ